MSGNNKAQFSLAIGAFEKEPGYCEWVAHPQEMHLLSPFTTAIKRFLGATILKFSMESAFLPRRAERTLTDCGDEFHRAKFRIRQDNHWGALTQLSRYRRQ